MLFNSDFSSVFSLFCSYVFNNPELFKERETEGPFTFQVVLNATGDIHFAYKNIPLAIGEIEDEEHPVKVGLSDAYIIDRTIFCKYIVQHKSIFGESIFYASTRKSTIFKWHDKSTACKSICC